MTALTGPSEFIIPRSDPVQLFDACVVQVTMKHLLFLLAISIATLSGAAQPNIIFLLSDDQHWNETSVQMHPEYANSRNSDYQTPHLEALASEGMRFSAAYAPAPVCSPTRASIQTGLSPATLHWCKAGPPVSASGNYKLLPPSSRKSLEKEQTFAGILQQAGYATAHFGKWHIGGGGPESRGYDVSDGDIGNEAAAKFKDSNPVDIVGMTTRAGEFMQQQVISKKPFYLQMSYLALHQPGNASQKNIARFTKMHPEMKQRSVQRMALTADLDDGVGALLDKIKKLKIENDTYVIYMSDNGAGGRGNALIKGGKGSLDEGGTRAVFIVRGPGVPENSWSHQRVVGYDLFPTFCSLAGVKGALPSNLEGGDLTKLFKGKQTSVERSQPGLLFHFPHYQTSTPVSALYHDDYKLVRDYESGLDHLYAITTDIAEKNDLSAAKPQLLQLMQKMLSQQLTSTNAAIPQKNPNYDPSKPTTAIKRGKPRRRK